MSLSCTLDRRRVEGSGEVEGEDEKAETTRKRTAVQLVPCVQLRH